MVYDVIDDLRVFPDPAAGLARAHRWLLERADLVLASAMPLAEQVRGIRTDVHLIPNAVDADYVREHTRRGTPPEELADLVREGRPIIGYHGALAAWVDYALLAQVARLRPEYAFVLIGPDYDGSLGEAEFAPLEQRALARRASAGRGDSLPGMVRPGDAALRAEPDHARRVAAQTI